ncbi:MAG: hypothetical protein IAF58_12380 [Leptolyngbya sp.]|nr:hypothetical protein [Candidatus Melainabacteria bacterium]
MKNSRVTALSVGFVLLLFNSHSSCLGAEDISAQLSSAVENSKILPPGVKFTVRMEGDKVTVSTFQNAKANDNDCKIDAVLLARAVMVASKNQVRRVTAYFYGKDLSKYREVSVTQGDVTAYGIGKSSQEVLLKSLIVIPHGQTAGEGPARATLVQDKDLVSAIERSKVLSPGVGISVHVDNENERAYVSTFRNPKTDDNDCKIDAVLIARTVIDASNSQICRVTAYFYDRDLSYKEVAVTQGDVAAFGGGQSSKETLLSSLVVTPGRHQDGASLVKSQLQAESYANPGSSIRVTAGTGNELNIFAQVDPWVTDDDLKLDAFRYAKRSLAVAPKETTKVNVSFSDPVNKADTRNISFQVKDIQEIGRALQSALGASTISRIAPKTDLVTLRAVPGLLFERRESLIARIKELSGNGVGIQPFLNAFRAIEDLVPANDETKIAESINKLSEVLDKQDLALKNSKNLKISKTASPISAPAGAVAAPKSRWVLGNQPIIDREVLGDTQSYIRKMETEMATGFRSADENPRFLLVLDKVSQILRSNSRESDAASIEQRASQIRARKGK